MTSRGATRGLDDGHRYVFAAMQAIAEGRAVPAPPAMDGWQQRAAEHEVLSVLAAHMPQVPALAKVRRLRAVHDLMVTAELRKIHGVLERADVEWLLFKGPVLDQVVYQRPGTRGYSDLDVLVRPADVGRAVRALETIGVRAIDEGWHGMQAGGDGESTYCSSSGVMVDVHWDVINDAQIRPSFAVPTEDLFRRAREVLVGGVAVRTFDPIDTLLHVVLHACMAGGDRLRWLMDIHQSLARCTGDITEIDVRATEMRLRLALRIMCERVRRFVDPTVRCPLVGLPSPLERSWLAVDGAMLRRCPPGARHEGRASGALVPAATRANGTHSWWRLFGAVPERSLGRLNARLSRLP
jgi:Uncharacterised nucleotidyltransferase